MNPSHTKILLFGFTRSCLEIASRLRQNGCLYTIIDNDASLVEKAEKLGFELKIMDYSDDILLQEEGVGSNVAFVFALFDEDAKNVFLSLSVRSIDEHVNIIALTHTKDAIHKLELAGANTILDPYQISGKKIYKLITQPEVIDIIDSTIFGQHDITMEQLTITKGSLLDGRMIHDLTSEKEFNVLLLGIHDKELKKQFIFITEGYNHKLDAGDILVVIGETSEIARYKKALSL